MRRSHSSKLVLNSLCLLAVACSCASGGNFALDVAPPTGESPAAFDHSHERWSTLLARHVKPTGLDYASLAEERETFDQYLSALQGVSPSELDSWTPQQRFAFWINVYNAYTVRLIVENYPVDSIKDLGGAVFGRVFDKPFIPLTALHPSKPGEKLALNDVEHEILRARFPDARVHAAINCASASCPPLLNEAFVADRIDAQLDRVMRGFVNDASRNRLDREGNKLRLSKIFDWFESDFARDAGSVPKFVARHADPSSAGGETQWIEGARVDFLDYSWKLNDAPSR